MNLTVITSLSVLLVLSIALNALLVIHCRKIVRQFFEMKKQRDHDRTALEAIRLTHRDNPERDQFETYQQKEINRLRNLCRAMRESFRRRLGRNKPTAIVKEIWYP